jgi:hypothetical protein
MQTILVCLWLKEKKKKKQKEFLGLYTHKEVIIREGKKNCDLEHARRYQRQNDLET